MRVGHHHPSPAVLVGHSLENDLKCMRIVHRRVLDTSLVYPHKEAGRKHALRILSSTYLKRSIQQSTAGHSSVEDARAALDLALKKVRGEGGGRYRG